MPAKKTNASFVLVDALLSSYLTNDRINHFLIAGLPDTAWRASPAKGRDIASIVAHMHNVRLMWLKSAAPGQALPAKLEGEFSKMDAVTSLAASCKAIHDLLAMALRTDGCIRGFKPDAAGFLAYLLAHDAHHRGQISMLARQLGHPLPKSAMYGMWEWGTRSQQIDIR